LDLASLKSDEYTDEMRSNKIDNGIIIKIENYRQKKANAFTSVKEGLLEMKTNKTATMESYHDYLQHFGTHYMNILEFNMYNTTRKWNFNCFVAKQKVGENKQKFVNNGYFVNLTVF